MKKIINNIIISLIIILLTILTIYFINNYNQFKIYIFKGQDESFFISGNATFSKKINLLNINKIGYLKNDIQLKEIKISLVAKVNDKERLIYATKNNPDSLFSLQKYLDTYSYNLSEQYGYNDSFNSEIIRKFKNIIYLKIEMIDESDNKSISNIKIESEEYSNDSCFYDKANHL